MRKLSIISIGLAMIALTGQAFAATISSNFNATATVAATCRQVSGATAISFGSYDSTDPSPTNATGTYSFRCTRGTVYKLFITGTRSMTGTSPVETLPFDLYTDNGHTALFPALASAATGVTSANNAAVVTTYYGQIPALVDVTANNSFTTTAPLVFSVEY